MKIELPWGWRPDRLVLGGGSRIVVILAQLLGAATVGM